MEISPWNPPQKPAELAESRLIEGILGGRFPAGSSLPAERELAAQLGVTRPTLREALQRLARDGWVEIRHGRPTRVRDYWQEGNLAVLGAMARYPGQLPENFVDHLLEVRLSLAPAYTRMAVERDPEKVAALLESYPGLEDSPETFAAADWELHRSLTILSGNPVFTLILNGFCDFYQTTATLYFQSPHSRVNSRAFYKDLRQAAQNSDALQAEAIARRVMADSLKLWHMVTYRT